MIIFIKKKITYIAIIFFVVISIQNLSKFNDFGMINMDENLDNPRFEEKSGDLSLSLQEEFFDENYIKLQRYELTKKNTEKSNQPLENNENLNVANYIDLQNATDYFIDEKNMNLS